MLNPPDWLSTEDAARHLGGVSARWVRKQIELRRLRARVMLGNGRATYRIRLIDLIRFEQTFFLDLDDEATPPAGPEEA